MFLLLRPSLPPAALCCDRKWPMTNFCLLSTRYIGETARPVPKKSDILVRVHAAGLNRADTLQRKGKYPAPKGESEIMGLEVYVRIVGSRIGVRIPF